MKILIVGGGVAGTALAGFMKGRADVTLIDKAPKWGDIGYGICMWGNGRTILRRLDIEQQVVDAGYELPWDVFENSQGHVLKKIQLKVFKQYGSPIVVTRTDLHKALVSTIDKRVNTRLGVTITRIRQRGQIATVTFSDGRKEAFDLVVGADGIHSKVRELTFGEGLLRDYGWTVYAFWSPAGEKIPKGIIELAKSGKIFCVYPMKDKAVVMLAISDRYDTPDVPELRKEKLHTLFADFDASVPHMIDAIPDATRIFHDRFRKVALKEWHRGRVVLTGDAQHATSPMLGLGTSMALEDAYVLSDELIKAVGPEAIPAALQQYSQRRAKRINEYRRISGALEQVLMVKSPFVTTARDLMLPIVTEKVFVRPMESILRQTI